MHSQICWLVKILIKIEKISDLLLFDIFKTLECFLDYVYNVLK